MSEIRYNFAYDDKGERINIASVSDENRHSSRFHCVSCGEELIPKLGKVRIPHFAHKVLNPSCNKETYLHKIGKWLLKSKFNDSETFIIEYQRKVKCKNCDSCPFYKDERCFEDGYEKFDLKKYYDTCTEEQKIGDFIADILLTNSKKKTVPPVAIEICVTHKSTEEKLKSGLRIIELRVKSEDDLLQLVGSDLREQETIVEFIGFSRVAKGDKVLDHRSISKFYLYKSGKTYVRKCNCNEAEKHKGVLELNIDSCTIPNSRVYEFGIIKSVSMGFEIKNCLLCKNYSPSRSGRPAYCRLRDIYEISKSSNPAEANKCADYSLDKGVYERNLRMFSNVAFSVVG